MMNNLVPYLLESSLILLVIFTFFYFVLRLKAQPVFNRFFLLFSVIFSVALPLISIPLKFLLPHITSSYLQPVSLPWNFLPELVIKANGHLAGDPEINQLNWPGIIGILYLTGVIISLAMTFWKLWKIRKLTKQFHFERGEGNFYKIANTNGQFPTFSFLHYIFWDNTVPLKPVEKQQILSHELTHVKQRHTLDLLFLEVLTACYWFNPVMYAYRRALAQVHEHLADRCAVADSETASYLQLMVKQTLRQAKLPLASSFFQFNTLNRIYMLQKKPTLTLFRAALAASIIGITFFVAACHDDIPPADEPSSTTTATHGSTEDFSMVVEAIPSEEPPLPAIKTAIREEAVMIAAGTEVYIVSRFKDTDTYKRTADFARQLEGKKIPDKNIVEELKKIGNRKIQYNVLEAQNNLSPSALKSEQKNAKGENIYEVVEDMPTPKGGMESFYRTIGENLKYPEEAVANGIEGRVYVQFIVEPDGTLSDIKVVKGAGYRLDQAAIEAIKTTSGQWEAGRQKGTPVNTRIVMPIMFKL